ncbi:MAG: CcmD family protein [Anaerolineae bacterium]|nr:CcmD family protein [Anaerolineae bacterium]MDW8098833.1 CcmD family protein [Anaerolineae bacterium]
MAYLAGAFAVAWLLVFGYVLTLIYRQRRLEEDIALLQEALQSRQQNYSR